MINDPEDFPALYKSGNAASLRAQQVFLRVLRLRLAGLLVAAIGGAISIAIFGVHPGGIAAFVGFTLAFSAELYSAITRPDKLWYEGRAAAESVKTLTWRFLVRGAPFAQTVSRDAEKQFLSDLNEILQDLGTVKIHTTDSVQLQITSEMREARETSFESRKELYRIARIENQQLWYAGKAKWNDKRGSMWTNFVLVAEGLGLIAGATIAAGWITFDLLGMLAAIAATGTAWMQAKQHQNLATAYSVTAQELASILSELENVQESDWPRFVEESEEAISREHTLWRASRGIRISTSAKRRRES